MFLHQHQRRVKYCKDIKHVRRVCGTARSAGGQVFQNSYMRLRTNSKDTKHAWPLQQHSRLCKLTSGVSRTPCIKEDITCSTSLVHCNEHQYRQHITFWNAAHCTAERKRAALLHETRNEQGLWGVRLHLLCAHRRQSICRVLRAHGCRSLARAQCPPALLPLALCQAPGMSTPSTCTLQSFACLDAAPSFLCIITALYRKAASRQSLVISVH